MIVTHFFAEKEIINAKGDCFIPFKIAKKRLTAWGQYLEFSYSQAGKLVLDKVQLVRFHSIYDSFNLQFIYAWRFIPFS